MRITIDPEKCLGNARCVVAAPEVFDVDEDGNAFLLQEDPDPALLPVIELAVKSCPTGAISLEP